MVFTLWLARPSADPHVAEAVQAAMRRGIAAREAIALLAAEERGLSHGAVLRYLTQALDYSWTAEHERSLLHFGEELCQIGLIPAARPLLYFGESGDQSAAPVESSQRT
jgi:predicted solute-binding protein